MIHSNAKYMRYVLVALLACLLSACVTGTGHRHVAASASAFAFLNSYDMALKDFQAGKVMEARARILAMDASRNDYKQAQSLLKKKINPARIRLLRHYKAKGKKAERNGEWSKAKAFYHQAAEFSAKPEIFLAYADQMDLKMRQLRMDDLLKEKRLEDAAWLRWSHAYEAAKGVQPNDAVLARMRNYIETDMESRANRSYREAYRFLNMDLPEVAYIEVESYLRLMPESEKGKRLLKEIHKVMPKGLVVRALTAKAVKASTHRSGSSKKQHISKQDILKLIEKSAWLQAKEAVLIYRRYEGKGADALLKKINEGLKAQAASLFAKGSAAFRIEHIDVAVKLWSQSVMMQPENSEYVDALRRAMQLQERLHLLRSDSEE